MNTEDIIAEARAAAANAHAPYSGFRVGAVVVAADGSRFVGANVENVAYGSTICAEASAIAAAVAAGARKLDLVAVTCLDAERAFYPCGNCRQLMTEFGVERVVVDAPEGPIEHTLAEILPYPFIADGD
jgi:cytidine deaminase